MNKIFTVERLIMALIAVCIAFGGYFVRNIEKSNELMQISINKQNELLNSLKENCNANKNAIKAVDTKIDTHIEISELYDEIRPQKKRRINRALTDIDY